MKYFLTITLCSMLDNVCVTPHTFPQHYDNLYNCQIDGYKKAIEKIEEIGIDKINEFKIYTTFACRQIDSV
jgi:hypothetical protein